MALVFLVAHLLGLASSLHALMRVTTARGAVAWILSLNTIPLVALPAYWIFGRSRLRGYVIERRRRDLASDPDARRVAEDLAPFVPDAAQLPGAALAGQRLAQLPFLGGNRVELLIDGRATFDSVLSGIERARDYVLVQSYVIRDDGIGSALRDRLLERAGAGVRVRLLYDEIGCSELPRSYLDALKFAGVEALPFGGTRKLARRFEVNFRNHRKIVVVDGEEGWLGGLNVGDEYLGRDPSIGPWRDTHLRIAGPSVLGLQLSFFEDWNWAAGEPLGDLSWEPRQRGDSVVLVLPSGPADRLATAGLMYQQAIHAARRRVWIASPYFVPDDGVLSALHLAALRGVDVRVLVPERSDSPVVDAAAWSYFGPLIETGVAVHRYRDGLLHSKHFVVDELAAGVGTANFDNRSFRLNFEITAVVADAGFVAEVAEMFERDLERSRRLALADVEARGLPHKVFSSAARLFAPVL